VKKFQEVVVGRINTENGKTRHKSLFPPKYFSERMKLAKSHFRGTLCVVLGFGFWRCGLCVGRELSEKMNLPFLTG
jgi:hypothetical protein